MPRSLAVAAVLLLLSISAVAQVREADVSLHLSPSPSTLKYHPREFVTWSVVAVNKGPQFAENVLVVFNVPGEIVAISPSSMTCNDVSPIRCTIPSLPPNNPGSGNVSITTRAPAAPGSYSATATITGATTDPNPADNTAAVSFTVSDAPDLVVSILNSVNRINPGERRGVTVFLGTGGQVAHDVRLSLHATGGLTAFITPPNGFSCSDGVCTAAAVGPESAVFALTLVAPDRDDGGTIGLDIEATSSDAEFDSRDNRASFSAFLVRQFPVTSTADAGSGSLRQAILDADAFCADVPCRIIVSATGTIHPQSPLPPIGGIVNLDGRGIVIRGDLLPSGDGLTIDAACEVQVQGLTITGFAWNGITIGSSVPCHPAVTLLNVPVVVAVSTITGNLRGIVGSAADTIWIRDNTIGSNRRSAIFLYGGRVAMISHNLLQSNGASGIYVNTFSANIFENTITGNTDFGIAVSATAPAIGMRRNGIFGNGHTAIDIGLDLEVGSSRVDLQACKLEYSIVSPK